MIASIMAIPTGATRLRLKIASQRGQVLALAEIIAPHARHEVILVMMLPRCLATAHLQVPVCDLSATRPSSRQASLRRGGRQGYSRAGLLSSTNADSSEARRDLLPEAPVIASAALFKGGRAPRSRSNSKTYTRQLRGTKLTRPPWPSFPDRTGYGSHGSARSRR